MKRFEKAFEQAKSHARSVYPEEMCGFVVSDEFIPVKNIAKDPSEHKEENCDCRLCTFKMKKSDVSKHLKECDVVMHSHPGGPVWPSQADMESQATSGKPWGIIALDEDRLGEPELFGDELDPEPLVGREFMHGVRDCYSVIRDAYRMGKDRLKEEGITSQWPFDPITLRDVPRNDAWWETSDDFYGLLPFQYGWKEIKMHEAISGDTFLCKIRSDKFNHAGLLVANDLILHHLPGRMSRREPAGLWARQAGRWLRYVGEGSNA